MNNHQELAARLHGLLTEFVVYEQLPGLAVGIVKDNQMLLAGEYGTANLRSGDPVVRGTLFHQASVSKTFVATALMQLAERGKVDLDGSITAYLPYFKLEDERYRAITVRQLLNHTSGMPDEDDYAWDRPEYDEESLERYVRGLRHHKLRSEPGAAFAYSNIGYEILGEVIAKVSGMSFEQYMKTSVLEPAGMRSSSFLKREVETRIAVSHVLGGPAGIGVQVSKVFPYNRAHGPSSTLYTNAEDMCRYMLMHVNRGLAENGERILQPDSYEMMWRPHAETGYGPDKTHVGLGWFLGEHNGSRILSHSGWDTGFLSHLLLLPDDGIAISVMTNCDYLWLDSVTLPILDVVRGSTLRHMKRSAAYPVGAWALSDGVDRALEEYRRFMDMEQKTHYVEEFQFMQVADALSRSGRREDAFRVLTCAAAIFPGSTAISGRLREFSKDGGGANDSFSQIRL
ncbi:serine hydrolase domain-containing protein [Paenibacillus silvisoli]|uniref:serine hydrolase domain-containing protein n=1 Tax=Paenibacillus silvisoli TaxID=3110539 RepID=UPI0028038433|nr:serine hydrolase domain-containing protein [Paenibacillus silvisoli]